jgi:nucleotide-binding universal stress UspA family protein
MKILAAVDGSAHTKRMLGYLAAHDEWLGSAHRYTLVNVVSPLPARAARALDRSVKDDYYAGESERVFKPIRTFFERQQLQAQFVGRVGEPAEIINELAAKGRYDLIVMGSRGHGSLGGLVLGSVAHKVLANGEVPVLLVR